MCGHATIVAMYIKFYTKDEWIELCDKYGMKILKSFDSQIRFPKKKATANGLLFREVFSE